MIYSWSHRVPNNRWDALYKHAYKRHPNLPTPSRYEAQGESKSARESTYEEDHASEGCDVAEDEPSSQASSSSSTLPTTPSDSPPSLELSSPTSEDGSSSQAASSSSSSSPLPTTPSDSPLSPELSSPTTEGGSSPQASSWPRDLVKDPNAGVQLLTYTPLTDTPASDSVPGPSAGKAGKATHSAFRFRSGRPLRGIRAPSPTLPPVIL